MKPLKHQVLLDYPPEQKKGGRILIPEGSQQRSQIMRVVACGSKAPLLMPGDRVYVQPYGGVLTKHDGKEYRLIHGDDILGVFE